LDKIMENDGENNDGEDDDEEEDDEDWGKDICSWIIYLDHS
jgi:hypothetical protein